MVIIKHHSPQKGVALIISLILLAAMMMTGIALFRSLGGAAVLAGNLTFTSAAIGSSDQGSESARSWLIAQNTSTLASVQPGYFPASCYTSVADAVNAIDCTSVGAPPPFDPTTFPWDDNTLSTRITADDGAGNEIRYVIHRLCSMAGSLSATNGTTSQQCTFTASVNTTQHSEDKEITTSVSPLFRITTRVRGPRGSTVYTQTTML